MSKISFVMPTKNRGDIIKDSIESIVEQSENDWELIIVDDHSDSGDKTKDMIGSFNDNRIVYVRMPDKFAGGIPMARNFGNIFARSEIIAVCDSDDLNFSDRARVTIDAFDKFQCDVFYAKYDIWEKEKNIVRERKSPIIPFNLEKLKEHNYIPHVSVAYKRSIAYDFPYNSFFRIGEDYELLTRLAKAGKKFYFYDGKVFRYVLHGSNISEGKRLDNQDKLIKIIRGWEKEDKNKILNEIIKT
ncbi:hypothetical protein A2215_03500 [Candidatus Berkelbacteria bacterium RIFOXYA2_FULL_43_10]|uniref:Glycosyltransferase 2-like domain-containing protein n=1 Tax=Candidatus Berkelbacteria bacterium RIFOXYA2_FULL_43_10 TaxID=1797472 RepID=A0A1F5EAL7_9BACT|nr:MAG: hypothetical protein A2215_03500 [Candidatus Berkelbacteria bacterium RIFOXYA2_FULL_43_10]